MAPPLITITRQFASGGSEIAQRVARELAWTVIDNEFVDEVARRAGLPAQEVARREERAPGLLERLARTLAIASPELFITGPSVPQAERDEATIVRMTERIILEAAALGRVVLVGRGAQAVLSHRPDALHVFVVASPAWRRRLAMERLGVSPGDAAKLIDETEHRRDQYVKRYYQRQRDDPTCYDLAVNSERLGFDGGAALVVAEARRRGWT
jgi:cytidylate kinase